MGEETKDILKSKELDRIWDKLDALADKLDEFVTLANNQINELKISNAIHSKALEDVAEVYKNHLKDLRELRTELGIHRENEFKKITDAITEIKMEIKKEHQELSNRVLTLEVISSNRTAIQKFVDYSWKLIVTIAGIILAYLKLVKG
jgi:uncharacterized protein (UPF0305 family)